MDETKPTLVPSSPGTHAITTVLAPAPYNHPGMREYFTRGAELFDLGDRNAATVAALAEKTDGARFVGTCISNALRQREARTREECVEPARLQVQGLVLALTGSVSALLDFHEGTGLEPPDWLTNLKGLRFDAGVVPGSKAATSADLKLAAGDPDGKPPADRPGRVKKAKPDVPPPPAPPAPPLPTAPVIPPFPGATPIPDPAPATPGS